MKRVVFFIVIFLILVSLPRADFTRNTTDQLSVQPSLRTSNSEYALSYSSTGISRQATSLIIRNISDLRLDVLNSYSTPSLHQASIDLTSYEIPGWTLTEASISLVNLTAALEREIVGNTSSLSSGFRIEEYDTGNKFVYEQLAQGFYMQPYDGQLVNYSVYYLSSSYVPAIRGTAYLVVRSAYTDNNSNVTASTVLEPQETGYAWKTVSAGDKNLSSNTQYYAIFDGRNLHEDSGLNVYPLIAWGSNPVNTSLQTRRYSNEFSSWSNDLSYQPFLNYSYIPWNQTSNTALVFSTPSSISLTANSSAFTGNSVDIVDKSGINSITINSNQSVSMYQNLTLWYTRDIASQATWNVPTSGAQVEWNVTLSSSYPVLPDPNTQFLNISIPSDWTPTGLYNSTNPSVDYGTYTNHGTFVLCSGMTNGTWTLANNAFNYLTNIQAPTKIRADSIVNINLTIQDSLSTPTTSGSTNLSVQYKGATVWTPSNQTVTTGFVTYSSNIGSWVTSNGTYTIEAFWTNGYEAGYLTKEMMVYYPTSLVAASMQIAALIYTGGSFEIRVDFTDTFASTELTATYATVVYSYDSGANVSLNDLGNGTWTADISTGGKTAGQHQVQIYGEGYGIENQTVTIDVSLTYQSLPLISEWSSPKSNSITYLESTHLSVQYNLTGGTAIQGATVNATDGTTTWPMQWDPVGMNYTIQFNGTDFSGLPKTVSLTVTAWKSGYETQVDSSLQLIVTEETGSSLSATVLPSDLSMTYVETLRITANYSYGGSPIASGLVQVEFNGSYTVPLQYNISTHLWYANIPASDIGLGTWNLNISADANGYVARSTLRDLSILEDTPTLEASWTDLHATTDYATNVTLNVTVKDSLGNPVLDADLTAALLSSTFTMVHQGNGLYSVVIQPEAVRGTHLVVVTLDELGYATTSIDLNLTILATSELVSAPQIQEYETEQLVVGVQFLDSVHGTPIDWGTVNLTIADETFSGEWNGTMFAIAFPLDFTVGYHSATITASAQGVDPATYGIVIQVLQKSYVYLELAYVGDSAEGNQISIQAVLKYNSTDAVIPYANINFEMTVNYDNGTTQLFTGQDSTNEQGVASVTFQIPSGTESRITSIDVTATYDGPKRVWDTSKSFVIPVHLGAIPQFMNWLFFEDGRYVILLLGIAAVGAYGYNSRIKPKKRARRVALDTQLKNFNDLKSIQHFMAVYLNRGTCVFYHPFREGRIQADLISGFISAVTSVYGEIKGNGVQGSLEEIHYHGLRLNSYNGKYVLGILILDEEISPLMRDRLQFFVELFENEYESHLDGWTGLTDCFDPEWIVTNLVSTFGYGWALPHTIRIADKLSGEERKVLDYIKASLGDKREFLIEDYIAPIAELLHMRKAEAFDLLIRMEENEIFAPISIHTVLQRQGMGMVATAEDIEEVGEVHIESSEEPEESIAEEPTEVGEPTPEEVEPEIAEGEGEEEPSEAQPEPPAEEPVKPEEKEKKHVDPKDAFVAEVESLLKKEKDSEDDD